MVRIVVLGPGSLMARYADELSAAVATSAVLAGAQAELVRTDDDPLQATSWSSVDHLVVLNRSVEEGVFTAAHGLRLIQKLGRHRLGFDARIPLSRGTRVCWLTDPCYVAVAEHTMLLMLALARDLTRLDDVARGSASDDSVTSRTRTTADLRRPNWPGLPSQRFILLHGSTLGLIGLGEIGSEVARRAKSMGMEVLYTKRNRESLEVERGLGITYCDLPSLLRRSRFISLHAAQTSDHPIIGRAELALIRVDAFVINTARGALVDEAALFERLRAGQLKGAALDAFTVEPLDPATIRDVPGLVLTPHVAGVVAAGVRLQQALENVERFEKGIELEAEWQQPSAPVA